MTSSRMLPAQLKAGVLSEMTASSTVYGHYGYRFAVLITTSMFALFASRAVTPLKSSFPKPSKPPRVEDDVKALLARMRQRQYPETIPALASFWLKTVYTRGYAQRQWKELNHHLKAALGVGPPDGPSREAIREIQNWIEETIILTGQTPECPPPLLEPVRPGLHSERLAPYIVRLLNEWVPLEVARILLKESESEVQYSGIPVLTFGSALERLLVREHLSRGTVGMLMESGGISPEYIYPPDLEILRDVALSLLNRTRAPAPSVMPAAPLCLFPQSHLRLDSSAALRNAFVVRRVWSEEVRVPIAPEQAREMLKSERVRIGSIIVTMDGRWWEAENLESGEQCCVVYRPGGRLRIDYSGGYARLKVPWPEKLLRWSGNCDFNRFRIFGREWRVTKCEVDGERSWLHLGLFRVLPVSEMIPGAARGPWQLRPASVDMAWTALGSALASSLVHKNGEPVAQLRHADLIPLGRGVMVFAQSLMSWRPQTCEAIESQLRALRDLQSPVLPAYGRIPWRILPRQARARLLKIRRCPAVLELLNEVVEGLPDALVQSQDQDGSARLLAGRARNASMTAP
jgi:hypothetical protein